MSAALHHYRGTDAACGGHARAGMRRLAGNGDQFYELAFGRDRPLRRAVFLDVPSGELLLTRKFIVVPPKLGRGCGPGSFPIQLRGGRFSHRRQANSLILLPGERLAATQFRVGTVQGSRAHLRLQTHRIKSRFPEPETNPVHFETSSLSHEQTNSERHHARLQTEFAFGAKND